MRAAEFVNERIVGTAYIGDLVIAIDDHSYKQRRDRSVTDAKIDQALRKLKYVESKLRKIEGGHKFWVDDPDTGISLGMRRSSIDNNKFYFNTVVSPRTYDVHLPVIALPSMAYTKEQLDELDFMGSECTKDCSGHRAGYAWSVRKGRVPAQSWSPSFNKGAALAWSGK
jgi:hypothetical protein